MEAPVKGPLVLPGPAAAEGAGTQGRQWQPQGSGRVPGCRYLLVALMSPSPADICLHGTHEAHRDHRAQVAPEVPGGLWCHARLPWENTRALFIFKALPAPAFIPAFLGGLCYCCPHLPVLGDQGLAKLCRSEGRRQGRVHGTEGNPNSWGSAGTCQIQPPPCRARRAPRWHTAVWNS